MFKTSNIKCDLCGQNLFEYSHFEEGTTIFVCLKKNCPNSCLCPRCESKNINTGSQNLGNKQLMCMDCNYIWSLL
jgi:hypothetical protein